MPTKTDLLRTVTQYRNYTSTIGAKLDREVKEARDALEDFCRTNTEYRKLKLRWDRLSEKKWQEYQETKQQVESEVRALVSAIHMKGPTPEVIEAVEKFLERWE